MNAASPPLVVFVLTGLDLGGAEAMTEKLVTRLVPRFRVHLISLTDLGPVGKRLMNVGINVEALGMARGRIDLKRWLGLVRRLRALAPAVVHTWMYHADLLGGLAARAAGVRQVIWCIRNTNLEPGLTRRSTIWVARACALLSRWVPTRIVCAGEVALQAHRALGYRADKLVSIPNGFDLARFRPRPDARPALRRALGWPDDAPVVGMVARFDPLKNHRGFARMAAAVLAQRPDVRFVLVGTEVDADNETLMAWLRDEKVEWACALLGRRDDVAELMAGFDVLVSTSEGEGFPNVLGEAMACGVACAVTDVGDSAAIVGDTGSVVPRGDMDGLARAVLVLLDRRAHDEAGTAQATIERVRTHYDLAVVVGRFAQEYERLLGKSP